MYRSIPTEHGMTPPKLWTKINLSFLKAHCLSSCGGNRTPSDTVGDVWGHFWLAPLMVALGWRQGCCWASHKTQAFSPAGPVADSWVWEPYSKARGDCTRQGVTRSGSFSILLGLICCHPKTCSDLHSSSLFLRWRFLLDHPSESVTSMFFQIDFFYFLKGQLYEILWDHFIKLFKL